MGFIVNFAHRGASGYCPENTMAAFLKAIQMGATGLETDVQMTKDRQLVLIHDETLNRTTGVDGLVKDYTLEELKQLDAGSWYHEAYRGEKIPALEELLELARKHEIILNLELKNNIIQYPEIEKLTADLVRTYGLTERVIISSFNHYSLVTLKKLAPELETAVLYMEGLYEPWEYARRIGASALHPYRFAVTKESVREAGARGISTRPFTVNEESGMRWMIEAGVAGIFTDYPDKLARLLEG